MYSSHWVDMKGHNYYYSSRDIPTEEIVILEEALKKEGAEIKVDI